MAQLGVSPVGRAAVGGARRKRRAVAVAVSPPPPLRRSLRRAESYLPRFSANLEHYCVFTWRLPLEMSQSRIGGRSAPSNACTLIAIRFAELLHRRDVALPPAPPIRRAVCCVRPQPQKRASAGEDSWSEADSETTHDQDNISESGAADFRTTAWEHEEYVYVYEERPAPVYLMPYEDKPRVYPNHPLSASALAAFVDSLIDGNDLHEKAVALRTSNEQNFTIPDAIAALGNSFCEVDYCAVRGSFLTQIPRFLKSAVRCPSLLHLPRLYMVMIAYERTVLLVYERARDVVFIADGHMHGNAEGGLLACASMQDVARFTQWITLNVFPETYQYPPDIVQEFEISFLYYTGVAGVDDCAAALPPPPPPHYVFSDPTVDVVPAKMVRIEYQAQATL